ncbi:MAG: endolytic transglycosylase MltG [Actinomycetes bacterium]|jgi:UPF0755 protein|nr:endolytic transglycosylase MltG [Actinomycetes bacterium]
MKSTKTFPVTLAFLVLLILLAAAGIGAGWWLLFSGNSAGAGSAPVTVTIVEGAGTASIARTLESVGIIDHAIVFRARVRFANADARLRAGQYQLTPGTDYDALIAQLLAGPKKETVTVTIPEGKTLAQTADIIAEKLPAASADDFVALASGAAATYVDRYSWLEGAYQGSLEGFLFPDTYQFEIDATAQTVIETMLSRFNDVWVGLEPRSADSADFTDAEIVTIASLVEREVAVDEERVLVSSVINNRLNKGMRLQLCSSVQFLLPGKEKSKLRLTNADIATESPYNTYLHEGLPPGPIANPGRDALNAALHPAKTKYLYFVLTGKDGSQTFAATPAEFSKAKETSKRVFGE